MATSKTSAARSNSDGNSAGSGGGTSKEKSGTGEIRKNVILALLLLAQFMAVIDVTIVNVAAPSVRSDLSASGAVLQLIVAGYTVTYSTLLITGARFGDRYGHARVFATGTLFFTLMSLACGVAPDSAFLIVARLLQGSAAAFMMPQVMSLIQRTFDGPERARAISLYGAVIAIGAVFGQVVGGLLVTANIFGLGWRPIFLVNVPIGLALAALVRRFVPRPAGDPTRGFDPVGAALIMATVVSLVIPVVFGPDLGWPAWSIAMLVLTAPLAALCGWYEFRRPGRDPILSSEVVKAGGFGWALLFVTLMQSSYAGSLFVQALHFESGLGFSPLHTGLLFIAGGAGFAMGSLTWRRFPARIHSSLLVTGMLIGGAGFLAVAWNLRDAHEPGVFYVVVNFALSAAFSYGFGPLLAMALSRVPMKFAGSASGILVSVFQIGQLLGISVFGSLFFGLQDKPTAAASASAFGQTLGWAALAALGAALAGVSFVRAVTKDTPQT